mmetsp:Transcript_7426/g.11208  ORF Transcript_7426/g.11208 Transcript_7426/m.11208 type:complete len:216 (-) Transcript_7426:8-655(-)
MQVLLGVLLRQPAPAPPGEAAGAPHTLLLRPGTARAVLAHQPTVVVALLALAQQEGHAVVQAGKASPCVGRTPELLPALGAVQPAPYWLLCLVPHVYPGEFRLFFLALQAGQLKLPDIPEALGVLHLGERGEGRVQVVPSAAGPAPHLGAPELGGVQPQLRGQLALGRAFYWLAETSNGGQDLLRQVPLNVHLELAVGVGDDIGVPSLVSHTAPN